jgi:cyclopropane fatty-acyl-phospholipid synthase-like methyltransferase
VTDSHANFDSVARAYRWLEYLSFGPWLSRCRTAQVADLRSSRHALVLGDGDGRFLERLLMVNPVVTADVVDSSESMLMLLERRMESRGDEVRRRVQLHHANALDWSPIGDYDLIVSHFFLDCFYPWQLEQLFDRILPHAMPGAIWMVSEFAIPKGMFLAPVARGIIFLLYFAFGRLTGLPVRNLPDYAEAFSRRGLTLTRERRYLLGLLCSQSWRLPTQGAAI